MQTKKWSMIETGTQFLRGLLTSFLSYQFILPWWGITIPIAMNLQLTAYFAILSIVLGFLIRRAFNAYVRPTMPRVQPRVGSIQSLRSSGDLSRVSLDHDKDPDAPIFKLADLGIVGDALDIIPKLIAEIERIKIK